MFKNLFFIFLLLLPLYANENEEESSSYELGNGLQVGELPLYIGGYISLDYLKSDDNSKYRFDDIALLGYGNYNKLSYMLELEFKEFFVVEKKGSDGNNFESQVNSTLHVERAYFDYNFNENFVLRAGKFDSPIGYWNMLPINVLRDTTSNPISTKIIYPKFTTGIIGRYTSYSSGELIVDIILQKNDSIDDSYNNYQADAHYGAGITYSTYNFSTKLNIGSFHKKDDNQEYHYAMLSAKYESDRVKISSELGTQRSQNEYSTKYAGYLQGLYRFTDEHIAIVRLESYEKKAQTKGNNFTKDDLAIVGYTYRPLYPVAIKAEYQLHSQDDANNAFVCSVSVMF